MLSTPAPKPYICARCLLRQYRRRSYSTLGTNPPPPPPSSGAAKLTTRRLISLHGAEAAKFLQGLVTNNVRSDSPSGTYAAFLTAPGKVLHDVFVYPTLGSQWHNALSQGEDPGYLVEVDADEAEGLLKHIKKHKLRAKFKLRLLDAEELVMWSAWKEDERWTAHTQGTSTARVITLKDCRAPGMGQRLLLPPASSGRHSLPAEFETEEAPLSAYTMRRYLRGVSEGQREIPREDSLPMNYNFDIMGGIDFKKGCYLGQELTIRTHHTGVVRRRVLPISLYPHDGPEPEKLEYDPALTLPMESGAEIRRTDKKKRATGKIIASIGNIGLGMCRLEQMSDLTVVGEGGSFTPDDRFVVQQADGQDVGVKAFVPDWMRGRIRQPKTQKRVE